MPVFLKIFVLRPVSDKVWLVEGFVFDDAGYARLDEWFTCFGFVSEVV